ncbi:type II secretion system protein [Telluria aromaticivorans]|nr:type II secretion system protein [Telluria aromaticivorans]
MRISPRRPRAFTLIELLVVLGIVALLLTLAVPRFFPSIDSTKETILLENLRNTRAIIDQYHADTGRYPESLEQLVEKKYLRELPMDPITETRDGWIVEPPPEGEQGAVGNVRSSAPGNGRKGTAYAEW